ncbi:hypothetical protein BCR34DRAFT_628086 [Clohesyomyces aquaticus]|uniref:LYR motif-containing protein Cup1-like N-terminal domain-containing protein n=1 Tax=Clohesyomyces aquaticus TaxID=1231657 RepID=A0A1Y1YPM8_9PLEO|nr:hypothetical protein BCR34DRAFT_628086 [Clohesyomyces aquaticus]
MPPPLHSSSANAHRARHLLRALLREATYLPDANARRYFRRYLVGRFRTASINVSAIAHRAARAGRQTRSFGNYLHRIDERNWENRRKARKGLNYLRRANLGEMPCLMRVLLITYGRVGKRKYQLQQEVLEPVPLSKENMADDAEAGPPLQELYYSDQSFLRFFDAPVEKFPSEVTVEISNRYERLKAVIKSQRRQGVSLHRSMKSDKLVMLSKNVWGRTMPVRRARNIVRRWYAHTMELLLPPLPRAEWELLRALATGEKPLEFPARRVPALDRSYEPPTDGARSIGIIEHGIFWNKPSKADKPGGKSRPHAITKKFMQRLYAKIFCLCCKFEYSETRQKWEVQWGTLRDARPNKYLPAPVDNILFSGVNNKGLISRSHDAEKQPIGKVRR